MADNLQQQIRALQAQIAALQQQKIVALPQAPQFALNPASLTQDEVIDYSTSNGMKIYSKATEALPLTELFDL